MDPVLEFLLSEVSECAPKSVVEERCGVEAVKESLHRGQVRVSTVAGKLWVHFTERGKRVAQGLPGDPTASNTFELLLREVVQGYLRAQPGKPELSHLEFEFYEHAPATSKVKITIK